MISVLLPSTDKNFDLIALGVFPMNDFSFVARASAVAAPLSEPDVSPLVRSFGWLARSLALVAIVDAKAAISIPDRLLLKSTPIDEIHS